MNTMRSEELERLKEEVKDKLSDKGKGSTIPELCDEVRVADEFKVMRVIAELQNEGVVTLQEFDKIYREDGGAIYLARYRKVPPSAAAG